MAEESSSSNVSLAPSLPGMVSSGSPRQFSWKRLTTREMFHLSDNDHEVQFDSESFVRCPVLISNLSLRVFLSAARVVYMYVHYMGKVLGHTCLSCVGLDPLTSSEGQS